MRQNLSDEVLRPLIFYRRGGVVKRFHCFDLLKENTVGHHTFNVVGILIMCVGPDTISKNLMLAALQHDLTEQETGDIPAPFKRSVEGLRDNIARMERDILEASGMCDYSAQLTDDEKLWLKIADSLEGALFCGEEYQRGNLPLRRVGLTFLSYVEELLDPIKLLDEEEHPEICRIRERFIEVYYEARRKLI